jgi:hypothetical protein
LYPQVGWPAAPPPTTAENVIAPATPSADHFNAFDLDAVGQNIDKIAAATAAGGEPISDRTDQVATGQEQVIRSTDRTATSVDEAPTKKVSNVTAEGQGDAASLKPASRLTDARPPQTLAERGKQLSAANKQDASCFSSASAVLQNHPGTWPTWTLRAPGHEGTLCWYAAARPRLSEHRPRVSRYRSETVRSEEEEAVGTTHTELFAPFAPYGRGGSWEGGLP